MNKILNINLGGFALTIDDDAYQYLAAYIDSIRKRFSESEGRDEIVNDIEMRLGELITGSMGGRTIVMLPDVEAAVEIMGKPEDFGAEPEVSTRTGNTGTSSRSTSSIRTGKRLFRDEEDATVGGVCSGLAAYFGIADPVWMRLIFVLLTFLSAGFWIPAYLLLWILVPPAKTAADRLAMRGEPINVDNIAREVEDGFDRLSSKVGSSGNQKKSAGDRSFSNAVSGGVSVIGSIFGLAIRIFAKFAFVIAILVTVSLFIALAVTWISGFWGAIVSAPYLHYFSPFSNGVTYLAFTNIFFILGIPLAGIFLMFANILFKRRTPGWVAGGLTFFWVVNLISALVLSGFGVKEFSQSSVVSKKIELDNLRSDTLLVDWAGRQTNSEGIDHVWIDDDEIRISDRGLELDGPLLIRVRKSETGLWECTQTIRARGETDAQATDNASNIEYNITSSGNHLKIPTHFTIPNGKKWRVQEVKITIGVPVGKSISFAPEISHRVHDSDYADHVEDYIYEYPDKTFRMTDDGLVCADCPNFGDRDYHSDTDYENFIIEGDFDVEIRKADDFRLEIDGPAEQRNAIKTIRSGGKLTLTTDNNTRLDGARVLIETPTFTTLYSDNAGNITLRGFDEGNASINARGKGTIKAYIDVSNLKVIASGKTNILMTGRGSNLELNASEGAVFDGASWQVNNLDLSASENANIRVYVTDDALILKDASSNVRIDGNANVRNKRGEE